MELSALLTNSSAKFRKEILAMPVAALLDKALKHMTLHRGVAGDETVGALGSGAEARPYQTAKNAGDSSRIIARTLTTYLGDVLEEFDPYILFTTVYGEQFSEKTKRTEAEIVRDLSKAMAKSVAKKLGAALFSASRNPAGTTTATLFNGFDTIANTEIAAGKISAANGNYFEHEEITAANVGDVLASIYEAASEELQESDNLKMFIPRSVKKLYDDWCLAHFGAAVYNTSYQKNVLHGTDENPCELVALSGMKNSDYIYLTTKQNMLVGCDQESDKEKVVVRVPDNPKVVQFFMCFFWGVQFQMIEKDYLLVSKEASGSSPVQVSGISLDKSALEVTAGSTGELAATLSPEGAVAEIEWASSDASVATVANGVVTGVAAGVAAITASAAGKVASCAVTVNAAD